MTYYYLRQEKDKNNAYEITAYRSAFNDANALTKFGNHRSNFGLDSALPLFKDIKFNWVKETKNPIGDIMSGSIFSNKAKDLIVQQRVNLIICEPISIEGYPAFFYRAYRSKRIRYEL